MPRITMKDARKFIPRDAMETLGEAIGVPLPEPPVKGDADGSR